MSFIGTFTDADNDANEVPLLFSSEERRKKLQKHQQQQQQQVTTSDFERQANRATRLTERHNESVCWCPIESCAGHFPPAWTDEHSRTGIPEVPSDFALGFVRRYEKEIREAGVDTGSLRFEIAHCYLEHRDNPIIQKEVIQTYEDMRNYENQLYFFFLNSKKFYEMKTDLQTRLEKIDSLEAKYSATPQGRAQLDIIRKQIEKEHPEQIKSLTRYLKTNANGNNSNKSTK